MRTITYRPIGINRMPFKKPEGTPLQASGPYGARGTVEVLPDYIEGSKDLDGFSHGILIYHFHLSKAFCLLAKPFLDNKEHGFFAIRGSSRIFGRPLLDIKSYVPAFDQREVSKVGWLKGKLNKLPHSGDDRRFSR